MPVITRLHFAVVSGWWMLTGGLVAVAQPNPSWSTYNSQFLAAMADARWRAVTLPQPRIPMSGQLLNGNLNALGSGRGAWTGSPFTGHFGQSMCNPRAAYGAASACTWNNAGQTVGAANSFIDAAYAAGVRALEVNMDVEYLSAATEYNANGLATASYFSGGTGCANGTQSVTFAANGGAVGTITVSGGTPTGSVTITNAGYGFSGSTANGQVNSCTGATTFNITLDTSKVIVSDCPLNSGNPQTFAYGQAPPAGTGSGGNNWACASLYNYDLMLKYAVNTYGMKLHLRVKPDSSVSACGWTSSSTEAQFIDCYAPLVAAAAKRWGSLADSVTYIHEAVGGFGGAVPFAFNTNWISDYITDAAATIRGFNNTLNMGACADTPFAGDAAYMAMYLSHPALNYVCVDLYAKGCTTATYGQNVLSVTQGWAQTAAANGKTIRLEEAGAPPHVPAACTCPDDTQAYEGSGWTGYSTSGLHDQWLETITPLMAAWGISGMTVFCDEWLMNATTNPTNASCVTFNNVGGQPPWLALSSAQMAASPTESGKLYARLGAWPAGGPVSLQGNARLSGRAHLGH
jgi:hypothetical protein